MPAPAFKLIAQPNDWEKVVRATTATQVEVSGKQRLYRDFWSRWIDLMASHQLEWTRGTRTTTASWYPITSGVSGTIFSVGFMRRGLISELYFEDPDPALNADRFHALHAKRDVIEHSYGAPLEWDPMNGRKATRIGEYLPGASIERVEDWDAYLEWFLDRQSRLRRAIAAAGGIR